MMDRLISAISLVGAAIVDATRAAAAKIEVRILRVDEVRKRVKEDSDVANRKEGRWVPPHLKT